MKKIILNFCLSLTTLTIYSQDIYPSPSPKGEIKQIVGNTTLEISYERPAARGRKIFGKLVPWNQVWRTGAGYCTKFSVDRPVRIGQQTLAAGTYSLFTLPNPEKWMVILNSDTTLYGSYDHDPSKDVARFYAVPKASNRYYETLTIDIDIIPNNAKIYISWANTSISFDVKTSTDDEVWAYIQNEILSGNETEGEAYASAADFLIFHQREYKTAISLAQKALELDTNAFIIRVNMDAYEAIGMYTDAIRMAELAYAYEEKLTYESAEIKERDLKVWTDHIARLQGLQKKP